MAELTKITRGMQNGAEAINTNFNTLTDNLKQSSDSAVKLTGDQTVGGKKTFNDDTSFKNISVSGAITQPYISTMIENLGGGTTVRLKRVGNLVTVTYSGQTDSTVPGNTNMPGKIPDGYKPAEIESIDFVAQGRHLDCYHYFNPDGSVKNMGEEVPTGSYLRGVRSYFTKDPWPTA